MFYLVLYRFWTSYRRQMYGDWARQCKCSVTGWMYKHSTAACHYKNELVSIGILMHISATVLKISLQKLKAQKRADSEGQGLLKLFEVEGQTQLQVHFMIRDGSSSQIHLYMVEQESNVNGSGWQSFHLSYEILSTCSSYYVYL